MRQRNALGASQGWHPVVRCAFWPDRYINVKRDPLVRALPPGPMGSLLQPFRLSGHLGEAYNWNTATVVGPPNPLGGGQETENAQQQ